MSYVKPVLLATALLSAGAILPCTARADGMVPETSVVIINEADGETTMKVKNTDPRPALLYTIIQHVPEDQETLFTVTPPVARVDPGQTQLVRFILTNKTPLKTERLARVIFDGIGERKDSNSNTVAIRVRQNLPVVITPKGLPVNLEPWKLLKWTVVDGKLKVSNDSPYVVRLGATVKILPMGKTGELPSTYLLPGQATLVMMPKDDVKTNAGKKDARPSQPTKEEMEELMRLYPGATGVDFQPATRYGYLTDRHQAKIETAATSPASAPAASPAPIGDTH